MPKNAYLSERIQKKLPKYNDAQVEYTGMKICKHFVICGGTGTGKTSALYNYILETSKPRRGTFAKIFVCFKTDEVLYDDLKEQLEDGIEFHKSMASFPSVNDFPDEIDVDYKFKFLVVFDDCVNDKDKEAVKKVNEYFTYGRKKGITLAFLSQSFFDTATFIRKQISYLLLLSIKGKRDLDNILRDYGSINSTRDQLEMMFLNATTPRDAEDMPFFKICTFQCPIKQKFSRDFLEYLDPADFQVTTTKTKKSKKKEDDSSDSDSERAHDV
jgi:hypothetical protein